MNLMWTNCCHIMQVCVVRILSNFAKWNLIWFLLHFRTLIVALNKEKELGNQKIYLACCCDFFPLISPKNDTLNFHMWQMHIGQKKKICVMETQAKKEKKAAQKWELCKQVRSRSTEHMTGMSATRWSERRRWQKVGNRELEERSRGEQLPCGPHYFPAVNFTCIFSPLCWRLGGKNVPSRWNKKNPFVVAI